MSSLYNLRNNNQKAKRSATLLPRSSLLDSLAVRWTSSLRPRVYSVSQVCEPRNANLLLGMDAYERKRAHDQATESAHHMYDEHYVRGQNADEYNPNQYDAPQQFGRGRDDY